MTVCTNSTFRNGERDSAAHGNEGTTFAEPTRGYIAGSCKEADLVIARGRIKQTSFTCNGSTVYGVDLLADEFSVLASKTERAEPKAARTTSRVTEHAGGGASRPSVRERPTKRRVPEDT